MEIKDLANKHGWNGVDNSKILATFLEERLETAAKLEKSTAAWGPNEFQDKQHDLMQAVQMGIVSELERAGFDPCPAIKIAAAATSEAWDIWGKFISENERLRQISADQEREAHVLEAMEESPAMQRFLKLIADSGMTAQEFAKAYNSLTPEDILEFRKKQRPDLDKP